MERGAPQSLPLMESGTVSIDFLTLNGARELSRVVVLPTESETPNVVVVPDPSGSQGHHCQPRNQRSPGRLSSWGGEQRRAPVGRLVKKKQSTPGPPDNRTNNKCLFVVCSDLGEQPSQRQRLLHHLRRGEPASGPLQHQAQLRGAAHAVGQDGLPGLHQEDRAAGCQRR